MSAAAATALAATGISALAAGAHAGRLPRILADLLLVHPGTAIAFALCGLALLGSRPDPGAASVDAALAAIPRWRRVAAMAAGACVAAFGAVGLFDGFTAAHAITPALGTWLHPELPAERQLVTVISALGLLFGGGALALTQVRHHRLHFAAEALALATAAMAPIPLLSYLFGTPGQGMSAVLVRPSLAMGLGLALLAVAILARPERRRLIGVLLGDRPVAVLGRRWLLAATLLIVGAPISRAQLAAIGVPPEMAATGVATAILAAVAVLLRASVAYVAGIQDRLIETSAQFRRLAELSSDWYWQLDAELRLTYLADGPARTNALPAAELLGKTIEQCLSSPYDGQSPPWLPFAVALAARLPIQDLEYAQYLPDRTLAWRSVSADPVFAAHEAFAGYVGVTRDITERKRQEANLLRQATHDALTGLPNRQLLRDRLEHALIGAERRGTLTAVLLADLDGFKQVNDSVGHDAGDAVLQAVAQRLQDCVRVEDTVARLSGDEFVVVLENLPSDEDASLVADKIVKALSQPIAADGREYTLSASVGVCLHPRDGADAATLMRNADAAMYQAKAQGRSTFCHYTRELDARSLRKLGLRNALRHAHEAGEFALHYQSIHDGRSGAFRGAEALLRWRRADGTLEAPGEFVPVAEESGLIVPIGEWVLRRACADAVAWQRAGLPPMPVAVNISAQQLRQRDLRAIVERALADAGLESRWLRLEITETMLIAQPEEVRKTLTGLAKTGVTTSLDDFGTGHSSLSYLRTFPIRSIKIDRSFIRDLFTDARDAAIVRALIALAHELGLEVIAEGVETPQQLEFLRRRGCDFLQGFLLGVPLPNDQFQNVALAALQSRCGLPHAISAEHTESAQPAGA